MINIDNLIIKIEEDKNYTIEEAELVVDALVLYKEINL